MQIAVIGPGGIGSTVAFQLSQAGHDVTVVARGRRLDRLQRDGAIVTAEGDNAAINVSGELDLTTPWDLVVVTVLSSHADELLPLVARSAATTVMFMFNTFSPLDRLRDAVGDERFAFGFPAIAASMDDGKLSSRISRRLMVTKVTDPFWAKLFTDAGIPATTHRDMQSWLRTHAAMLVPLVIAGNIARRRGSGLSRKEAVQLARAMNEGLALVCHLGDTLTPASMMMLSRLPVRVVATCLWALTRVKFLVKTVGLAPADEARMLIDEMCAVAPRPTPALLAVRPED